VPSWRRRSRTEWGCHTETPPWLEAPHHAGYVRRRQGGAHDRRRAELIRAVVWYPI
jgi:hypothetical protein